MIPNEILAAWMVAATTGLAAFGGLSLLDNRSSQSGLEAEPLPFYHPNITTALRLPPPDIAWRSRLKPPGACRFAQRRSCQAGAMMKWMKWTRETGGRNCPQTRSRLFTTPKCSWDLKLGVLLRCLDSS